MLILGKLIEIGFLTVCYLFALLVMIKAQKLNFSWPGLAMTAAVAAVAEGVIADLVPFVGLTLSFVVVYVCIVKTTGCDLFPEAVFTASLSWAFVFCAKLFVLAKLMGPLSVPDSEADLAPLELETEALALEEAQADAAAEAPPAEPAGEASDGSEFGLILKGVSGSSKLRFAMIGVGSQNHTFKQGESRELKGSRGPITVLCDAVDAKSVALTVTQDGEEHKVVMIFEGLDGKK